MASSNVHDSESDFYMLGSGFSKEIADCMPTLNDLGDSVIRRMDLPTETLKPFNGNLERWLSHISIDQPWLETAMNLRNRSLFIDASKCVAEVIRESESRVDSGNFLPWIRRFALHLCQTRANVATLNYDLLLERAIRKNCRIEEASLYGIPIMTRQAPGVGGGFLGPADPICPMPTLYKLHGSTNWLYGGPDAPVSDRIVLDPGQGTHRDRPDPRYRYMYDDLRPLIVPPTATKAGYYGNLSIKAQWKNAHEALKRSSRLIVMGFSFPETDQQLWNFMMQAVRDKPVMVVDRSPKVAARLEEGLSRSVSYYPEISDFVSDTCGDVAQWTQFQDSEGFHVVLHKNGEVEWEKSWPHSPIDQHKEVQDSSAELAEKLEHSWGPRITHRHSDQLPAVKPLNASVLMQQMAYILPT